MRTFSVLCLAASFALTACTDPGISAKINEMNELSCAHQVSCQSTEYATIQACVANTYSKMAQLMSCGGEPNPMAIDGCIAEITVGTCEANGQCASYSAELLTFTADAVKSASVDGAEKGCYCARLQATSNQNAQVGQPLTACGTKALCDDGSCSEVSAEADTFTADQRQEMTHAVSKGVEADCKTWIETICTTELATFPPPVTVCQQDSDCEEGKVCAVGSGECIAPPEDTSCKEDSDCAGGKVCSTQTGDCVLYPAGPYGLNEGDVIANLAFIDQCEEEVSLWDFAGEYHILWMTAAW